MIPGIEPTVDYAFKKVFGSEANTGILASLLDAVLRPPPERRIVSLEIANPFNEKEALDDKLSVLDIKARDQHGRQYNIEMQMLAPRIFPQRLLYYWAVLHGQQLREGENYPKLKATISICFVNSALFPQVPDYHLDFQLRCSRYPDLVFSDQQEVHLLELPKFRKNPEELDTLLDVWCYFLVHGATLDMDNLPVALQIPPVKRAMEVLLMLTQSDLERERYQARLKGQRDQSSYIADAREEGLEKGREEGQLVGRIWICQRLLNGAVSPVEELLALPMGELRTMAETLEKQLGLGGP